MNPATAGANPDGRASASIDLYWLPLGAGGVRCVRWNGRAYERIVARHAHRRALDLYHSALQVQLGGDLYVIEMAPVWGNSEPERGVVGEGAVGLPWLGRSRLFRYEVRRWRNGVIPDVAEAVASPRRVSANADQAQRVLDLAPHFPTVTWGRDELHTGDMWNSNSLISWLLARTGHPVASIDLPPHGRAPGWTAGLVVATRQRNGTGRGEPLPDAPRVRASGGVDRESVTAGARNDEHGEDQERESDSPPDRRGFRLRRGRTQRTEATPADGASPDGHAWANRHRN